MSAAILLTTNQEVAEKTLKQLEEQAAKLERYEILSQSLENYGLILICESEDEMIDIANRIAPEHLEIMTADPMAVLPGIEMQARYFADPTAPNLWETIIQGPTTCFLQWVRHDSLLLSSTQFYKENELYLLY